MKELVESQELLALRKQIVNHPVFDRMKTLDDLIIFTEYHVWIVWDFMFLTKKMHAAVTGGPNCVHGGSIWLPPVNPQLAQFANEILLSEESDEAAGGKSHLQWYIDAMKQLGANSEPVEEYIKFLRGGHIMGSEFKGPKESMDHFYHTMNICGTGIPPKYAVAVFCLARENLIPDMFKVAVETLYAKFPAQFTKLMEYMNRHIEVDGDDHGPMSIALLEHFYDESDFESIHKVVKESLEHRLNVWDAIFVQVKWR